METRIQKTLYQWFPDAFTDIDETVLDSDYETLKHFAHYTKELIKADVEDKSEPYKIINLLYSNGSLFERNAIENSFFYVLAFDENPQGLKENLNLMPEELREVYIKTILEN